MSEIVPYWQSADGMLTVYNARYEDVLEAGLVPVEDVALIHDDPPWGVNEKTNRHSKGRGINPWFKGGANAVARDFPAVVGDDRPFDPSLIISLKRPTVLWGANNFSNRLPPSRSWLLWDKRVGVRPDDNGDGELAWSNLGGPPRIFRHLWKGSCRASETGSLHRHGTQKPEALSRWVFERAKLSSGDLVFVPHMGSGPDLPEARRLVLRLIACDVEQWCCDTAIARLPEAPIEIVERAKAFQLSTRAAPKDAPLGPLFNFLSGDPT